jgi:hypothetical protein
MVMPTLAPDARPEASDQRWIGVGRAAASEPKAEAAREAIAGRRPSVVLVFASSELDLAALMSEIRSEVVTDVPVVGCTTAGELSASGLSVGGVVVVALGGPDLSVVTAVAENVDAGLRAAGAKVAATVSRLEPRPYRILLLLTDGLAGDQQEIVRGAYSMVGAQVPLVGGCAGDDLHMKSTSIFYDNRVLTNAIVGVAIGSTAPFGIGVRHGWRRVGEAILVTGSSGTTVRTLDDEPALDVYLRRLGAPAEATTDSVAFTKFAMTHPLGLSRRSGEEVRAIAGADFEARTIQCIAQVPQGGLAWIMEGDDESVLAAADAACAEALQQLGGHDAIGVLAFDCIARRSVLGEAGTQREVERISQAVKGAPVAGFYSYGEIARTKGTGGFHNQTLVVLAMS